ncbi:hypothetical protein DPMN_033755 [Dreissena polymorpha]|uniref:Uncharacterized protein n=1 Tax=Dreissena polymorpha TaxID=45954 RepID=A0A9D4M7L3_DREPO|nr:hypothetical protein DPMN_033755 [Dreissena polymorpha]
MQLADTYRIPALERIGKLWEALCKYFMKDPPNTSKDNHMYAQLTNNSRYLRMCQLLISGNECKAQI